MWSNVIVDRIRNPESPSGRYKHGMCLVPIPTEEGFGGEEQELWIYGGRSGTFPMKDLWKLQLNQGIWTEVSARSLEAAKKRPPAEGSEETPVFRVPGEDIEWPPCLQEHTMIHHRGSLYVFGGEISINYEDHTPLWIYNLHVREFHFLNLCIYILSNYSVKYTFVYCRKCDGENGPTHNLIWKTSSDMTVERNRHYDQL